MNSNQAKAVLDALEGGLTTAVALMPDEPRLATVKTVARVVAAGLGLVGDLIAAGEKDIPAALTRIRPARPQFQPGRDEVEAEEFERLFPKDKP